MGGGGGGPKKDAEPVLDYKVKVSSSFFSFFLHDQLPSLTEFRKERSPHSETKLTFK